MKKIWLTLILIICLSYSYTTFAQNEIRETDIGVYINNFPINSYNLNNQTVVFAGELKNYGFNVLWDSTERSVRITLSDEDIKGSDTPILRCEPVFTEKILSTAKPTDIVTYVNGKRVESFNIDNSTVIYLRDLNVYGDVKWSDENRSATLFVSTKNEKDYEDILYKYNFKTPVPTLENIVLLNRETINISEYSVIYKYDGKSISVENFAKYISLIKKYGFFPEENESLDTNEICFRNGACHLVIYPQENSLCIKIVSDM